MTKPPSRKLLSALAPSPREVYVHGDERDTDMLDRADAAYRDEAERWGWRRSIHSGNYVFEVYRVGGPRAHDGSLTISDDTMKVIRLTKRECGDRHNAEAWLNSYRGRAAMHKALEAL
jgi:hypothetical protein